MRFNRNHPRVSVLALIALVLVSATLLLPATAAADGPRGAHQGRPRGDAGAPAPSDPAATADGGSAATATVDLNLRGGPSMESAVLTVIPAGAVVAVTGAAENGFAPVVYAGTSGYAYAGYLGNGADSAAAPAAGDAAVAGDGADQQGIIAIIYAAADAYGQSREDMLRVATCESGLDPYNVTPPYDASGLFQFLPSTWASTPFAGQDIFDPVANANAAAWMWSVGRRGEWVCQ